MLLLCIYFVLKINWLCSIQPQKEFKNITFINFLIVFVILCSYKIVFTRKDYSDIELRVPSVEKARDLIDFEAKVDLEEGIKRTAAYYRGTVGSSTKIR